MQDSENTVALSGLGRLRGRRILITGGASGIGRATALLFAAEGAILTIVDRDQRLSEEVAHLINGVSVVADISSPAEVEAAVKSAARAMSGIDGIVNAAGITVAAPVSDTTPEMWRKVIDVNLTGSFLVVQAALPFLQAAQNATVVNIASGAALLPRPNRVAYASSKGGVLAMTRALAIELAPGIRVNAICPGMVDTPILEESARTSAEAVNRYALKRMAKPVEIANSILFLSSSESSYTTGVTLSVDGGRTFH
jgi:NAD(P)-dependent dehydrogenase (short-subunit alcohol dehydrogenase family)